MAKKPSTAVIAGKSQGRPQRAVKTTRVSVTTGNGKERSVEVRKIENGYILRESTWDGKGAYHTSERYCEKAPTLAVESAAKAKK